MLRPKMACIEEMQRNVLPYESIEIFDVLVGIVRCGESANVESKLSFHDFDTANRQMAVGLVNVDEVFVTSLCIMQEVNKGRMKGECRLMDVVRVNK